LHTLQRHIVFKNYFKGKRAEANVKPIKSEIIQFKRDQTNKKPRSITALETVENQKMRWGYKMKINLFTQQVSREFPH
jgi:hypothetical protein